MNRNKQKSGVVAGILLPMGLICLFAFCSLALALLGGRAYKQIQGSVDDSFGSTVAASYLRTKLSQNNHRGAISLREENGAQVLIINSQIGGADYETVIYALDGRLMEGSVQANRPFTPNSSDMHIADIDSCIFALSEDGLFTAEITSLAGTVTSTAFAVAEGGGL